MESFKFDQPAETFGKQSVEQSEALRLRQLLEELEAGYSDKSEHEKLVKELVSGMYNLLYEECSSHGGELVDLPSLSDKLTKDESLVVRNELPEKVWGLLHDGEMVVGEDPNPELAVNRANSLEWQPSDRLEKLRPVYEGRNNFHGLFSIIGAKPSTELSLSPIKSESDDDIAAIKQSKTYSEDLFRRAEGKIKEEDLRFIITRTPGKYFPHDLMSESELYSFKKSETEWEKFREKESSLAEAKKNRQIIDTPYPKRPPPFFIYRTFLFNKNDQIKKAA